MSYNYLPLDRKWLNFQQVKNLLDFNQLVSITFDAHERILKCRKYLDEKLSNDEAFFNSLNTRVSFSEDAGIESQVEQLQYNLIVSNTSGSGEEVPVDIVKLMLMLKIKSLGYGHSGVQIETVKRLMEMYNNEVCPVIYTRGSGDLALLSYLSLSLIGLGQVYYKGEKKSSAEVLNELNWQPLKLQSNEAPALITGTHFISAYGMYALKKTDRLLKMADLIAALSLDVFNCSPEPFQEKLQSITSHRGQAETAAVIKQYLHDSEMLKQEKQSQPDPYSFKCIPQVHGASKDAFEYVLDVFLKEINSVTEDPVVFPDEDLILSGGNSYGQHLALALDFLAVATNKIAGISCQRTSALLSGQKSLPSLIAAKSETQPGLVSYQSAAAAIISENRQLCAPASVNDVSNEADYAGSAASAVNCLHVIYNVEKILAIELLCAVQALQTRRPLKTSAFLEQVVTDFTQQFSSVTEEQALSKAIDFISSCKL